MTRDEAIGLVINVDVSAPIYGGDSSKLIDKLEALGLLKLEEPKTPEEMLRDVLPREGYVWGPGIPDVIASAGLRVVRA